MRFIYMNLEEHPRGDLILQKLLVNGFKPDLVIEESSKLAINGRNFTNDLLKNGKKYNNSSIKSTKDLINDYNLNYISAGNLNDNSIIECIKKISPNLILLGDTRIIK